MCLAVSVPVIRAGVAVIVPPVSADTFIIIIIQHPSFLKWLRWVAGPSSPSLVALSMALCVHMFTNVSTMYARIYYNTFNETHHSAHSPASQQLRYNDNEKLVRVRFF